MKRSCAGIDRRQAQVVRHAAVLEQRRQPAAVLEGFAADGGVIQQLAADLLAEEFVVRQFAADVVGVGQVAGATNAVGDARPCRSARRFPDP